MNKQTDMLKRLRNWILNSGKAPTNTPFPAYDTINSSCIWVLVSGIQKLNQILPSHDILTPSSLTFQNKSLQVYLGVFTFNSRKILIKKKAIRFNHTMFYMFYILPPDSCTFCIVSSLHSLFIPFLKRYESY